MFIALLFLPILRNLRRRKVPKYLSIVLVLLLIVSGVWMGIELIKLSSKEILTSDSHFFDKAQLKINSLVGSLESFFGIQQVEGVKTINKYLNKDVILNNLSPTVSFISKFLTALLTTTFFVVLWLAESINVERLINRTLLKQKHTSIKTFRKIEKDLIKFIKVKFLVSFLTGIGTGLACYFFDVSFPIFWGLFAFIINFVQMVGSFITVILLSIFAFVELEISSVLLFFIISITSVQILFGAILEPIFMGKSFSINIIAVLVMLMFWGFIWGVPGLIMAIPITVFIKIILEQFPRTKIISDLLSGS
jgi:predicted PurR-regulated permease PerM